MKTSLHMISPRVLGLFYISIMYFLPNEMNNLKLSLINGRVATLFGRFRKSADKIFSYKTTALSFYDKIRIHKIDTFKNGLSASKNEYMGSAMPRISFIPRRNSASNSIFYSFKNFNINIYDSKVYSMTSRICGHRAIFPDAMFFTPLIYADMAISIKEASEILRSNFIHTNILTRTSNYVK